MQSGNDMVRNTRLIARLDIKGKNLIKSICMEGLRVVGSPIDFAHKYYMAGIDELIFMDCVASLYGRNHLSDLIKVSTKNIFIPITVGGGIRSVEDAVDILRAGADKVAINTAAVNNPALIEKLAKKFGSQSVVLSVEAKKISNNHWEVYTNGGREKTGLNVVDWVNQAVSMGVGEVLVTSIDKEGTRKGFDVDLMREVTKNTKVPVIASGGMGSSADLIDLIHGSNTDAVAVADILHYEREEINMIRESAIKAGINLMCHD